MEGLCLAVFILLKKKERVKIMSKLLIISDRNIYVNRIMNVLAEEHQIMILCRNRNGMSEKMFHTSIHFRYFSSDRLLTKTWEFFKCLLFFKPQIVQVNYLVKDAVIPTFFRKIFKYRYLITIWGSDLNIFSQNKVNRLLQEKGLQGSDQILLLSDFFIPKIKSLFPRIFDNKMKILSWGIEYSFFNFYNKPELEYLRKSWGIPNDYKVILSFRNLKPLYNQKTLISAIPEILKKHPQTIFIIICGNFDSDYLLEIKDLIRENNIESHVLLQEGWVDRKTIAELLNISNISVSIPEIDGLPASLLETMCTRSIPLISNLDNYHSFIKDNENAFLLRDLKNPHELSVLILKILNLPISERKNILRNNRDYILKYQNWDKQLIEIKKLYKQVL